MEMVPRGPSNPGFEPEIFKQKSKALTTELAGL